MLKRPAKGQALVMGLVVLFMGAIMLFFLFSTGQVSADKQRVTNAADAAAYSAALWRARFSRCFLRLSRRFMVWSMRTVRNLMTGSVTRRRRSSS